MLFQPCNITDVCVPSHDVIYYLDELRNQIKMTGLVSNTLFYSGQFQLSKHTSVLIHSDLLQVYPENNMFLSMMNVVMSLKHNTSVCMNLCVYVSVHLKSQWCQVCAQMLHCSENKSTCSCAQPFIIHAAQMFSSFSLSTLQRQNSVMKAGEMRRQQTVCLCSQYVAQFWSWEYDF